jgi:hypothetical protein
MQLLPQLLALFIFILFGCHNKTGRFWRTRKSTQPFLYRRIDTTRPAFELEDSLLKNLGGVMNIIGGVIS